MRAILPSIATLAILCAACSDTTASPTTDVNREAVASVVGGVSYPLVAFTLGSPRSSQPIPSTCR